MTTWIQFALRRRVSPERFISGLPDAAQTTVEARLVELGVDPATFPWHELAAPVAEPAVELPQEPPAESQPEAVAEDPPPEAQDG